VKRILHFFDSKDTKLHETFFQDLRFCFLQLDVKMSTIPAASYSDNGM